MIYNITLCVLKVYKVWIAEIAETTKRESQANAGMSTTDSMEKLFVGNILYFEIVLHFSTQYVCSNVCMTHLYYHRKVKFESKLCCAVIVNWKAGWKIWGGFFFIHFSAITLHHVILQDCNASINTNPAWLSLLDNVCGTRPATCKQTNWQTATTKWSTKSITAGKPG